MSTYKPETLLPSAIQMAEADNYNDWTFSLFEKYLKGQVLEVGCGVGSFTRRIVEHGRFARLLSIDVSAEAVAHTSSKIRHPALEFRHQGVNEVNGEFDTIICMNVLEHIEDDETALRHMLGLLRPGGTLFLLVPSHRFLFTSWDTATGHYRRYDKRPMQRLVAEVTDGFTVKLTQYYFNLVGAVGYYFVYKVMRKAPSANAISEIGFFDRYIVPLMRNVEGKYLPLGLSLISVITKE